MGDSAESERGRGGGGRSDAVRARIGGALAALLVAATLGEGGASPNALLGLHGGLVLLTVAALAAGIRWHLPDRATWSAIVIAALVATIAAIAAPYAYAGYVQLQEVAACVAVVALAATCAGDLLRRAALPLLACAAAHGGYALVLRFAQGVDRPASSFFNPNHLAAWIVAVLFVAAGTPSRSRGELRLRWALAVPAAAGLALTTSRGAVIGAAAGAAVWLAASWSGLSRPMRRRVVVAIALGAVGAATMIGVRLREADAYAFHRVGIWRSSLAVAVDHAALGVGPGQFAAASRAYLFDDGQPPMRYDRRFSNTHSDWLRPAVEAGIPGALAALALVGCVATRVVRRARHGRGPDGLTGASAALAALAVQGGVENLSDRPALTLLAAALIGHATVDATASRSVGRWTRSAAIVVLITAFVLGDVAPWLAWRGAIGAPDPGVDRPARVEALERTVRLNPVQPFHRIRLVDAIMISGPASLDSYAVVREQAEAAVRLQPADSEVVRALARVEASACVALFRDASTRDRALAAYRRAAELAPFDATLPLETAEFLRWIGDPAAALGEVDRALALEPESVAGHLLRAEIALDPAVAADASRSYERAMASLGKHGSGPWDNPYTTSLMRVDPARLDRVRRALSGAPAAP